MNRFLFNRTGQTIFILLYTILFFSTLFATQTQTVVVVIEGEVYCFEIEEYTGQPLEVGKLLFKISEENYIVKIKDSSVIASISQKKRAILSSKLTPGILVLLMGKEQNRWEIVSVGIKTTQGELYTKGQSIPVGVEYTAKLIPSVPPSTKKTSIKDISKTQGSKKTGTGSDKVKSVEELNPDTPKELPSTPPPPPKKEEYQGPDYYVDPYNGDDENHSGRENSPLKTIQTALKKVEESGYGTIHLNPGVYSPSTNGENYPLRILSEVNIIGTDRDDVILDAEGSGIIIEVVSKEVNIKSLTIRNGYSSTGAGINIKDCNSVMIEDVVIEDCYASASGGAVYIMNTYDVVLSRCIFRNNQAPNNDGGGIIYSNNNSNLEIINCLFYGNSGYYGCIAWYSSSGTVHWCTFNDNSATQGACIFFGHGPASSLTVVNNIFANSTSGYALYDDNNSRDMNIDYNFFYNNFDRHYWKDGGPTPIVGVDNNIGNPLSSPLRTNHKIQSGTTPTPIDNADSTDAPPNGKDLAGSGRRPNGSGYDMGCYEWYGDDDSDPVISGYVYNSITQELIEQPVVAIYKANTTEPIVVTTDNPFRFNVNAGRYYIVAYKEGFAFPSYIVNKVVLGDHGEIFTVTDQPIEMKIPLDPQFRLEIEKKQNKRLVEVGEILTYHFTIRNYYWFNEIPNVILHDQLVNGFKYIKGSLHVNGEPYNEENVSITKQSIRINLGTIHKFSTTTISYQIRVGSGVIPGRYKTSAYTRAGNVDQPNSNLSTTEIEVIETPIFTKGTIIGKVFWDWNKNGIQDTSSEELPEIGIPHVKIYTEYGVTAETDEVGKYHIANVPPGRHLLKIDPATLPEGVVFTTENPYLVEITEGLPAKVNFGITQTQDKEEISQKEKKFFIVALGEAEIRDLSVSGNVEMVDKDDRFDRGITVDGRIALFLKGKVLGKYIITASLDTDRLPEKRKTRRSDLYRKLFTNLDPEKYYPVYGDASRIDYKGVDTQDVLYLLIEWDESFAKWGSFHTNIPIYNRTVSGGIINYKSVRKTKFGDDYTKLKLFGAFSHQKASHDEFVATGGSLYYLRHRDIIEGSEKVRVEIRDRISKTTIISIPLREEIDYQIDYDSGRILLTKPLNLIYQPYLNSIISNDILMGEHVYLVVDYEYYSPGLSDQTWGIQASQWLGNHIRIGGMYIEEQRSGDPYKLMEGNLTFKLDNNTQVTAVYSRTEETQMENNISFTGGLDFTHQEETYSNGKSGSAFSATGTTTLFGNTDITLTYSREDPYYSVTNNIASQGTQKYIASIINKPVDAVTISLTHITQKYFEHTIGSTILGATDSHTTTAALDYNKDKWDIRIEARYQNIKHPVAETTYFGTLPLLDNSFLGLRIGYQLFLWFHPYIRGQLTIDGVANDQASVGADINMGDNSALSLIYTEGTLGNSTAIGLISRKTQDTEIYTNIELGNNIYLGKYAKSTYGQSSILGPGEEVYIEQDYSSYRENLVRGTLLGYNRKLSDTIGVGLTYERSFIDRRNNIINRDTGSITLTYLNPELLNGARIKTKLEIRDDRGTTHLRQWISMNEIMLRITDGLTFSGTCNWGWTENRNESSNLSEFWEIDAGFSYRPVLWDKLNIIGKYTYLTDYPYWLYTEFPEETKTIKKVYALEGIYDICKYFQLVGKFAYRDMDERVGTRDWTHSDTYLWITRLNFHITKKWDLAGEYRILTNNQIEDSKEGWLFEVNRELLKYFRIGVGYNFTDYDDDLRNSDEYDAKGWFIRVTGKY